MRIRPLTEADHGRVLELNEAEVPRVNSIGAGELADLVAWSELALVAEIAGRPAGFVITLRTDVPYGSRNYAWFAEHHPGSHYLDRVVVAPEARRRGVASALYERVESHRRPVALEVNLLPPNEPSLAYHSVRGYERVGELSHAPGMVCAMLLKS